MRSSSVRLILGMLVLVALSQPAFAIEKRVALVIGNSSYDRAGTLPNPASDAEAVAEVLGGLGFTVSTGIDLNETQFVAMLDDYARAIVGADVALFYFAGHGMQFEQENYLIPTDARLESQFAVRRELISLDEILTSMQQVPIGLVFIDACRNNPLSEDLSGLMTASGRSSAVSRGLAPVRTTGSDTLIAFAAAPGAVAEDGAGNHSPFTASLIRHLPTKGVEISTVLKRVTLDVRQNTQGRQNPEQITAMASEFYMAGKTEAISSKPPVVDTDEVAPVVTLPPVTTASRDLAFSAALQINTVDAWQAFLGRYPDGPYSSLAQAALAKLTPAPAATPESPTATEDAPVEVASVPDPARTVDIAEPPAEPSVSSDALARFLDNADAALGKKNYADAADWLEQAVALGSASAAGNLAYLHAEGLGVDRDLPQAVSLFEQAIDGGNAVAAFNYGWLIERGNGISRDPDKAAKLFTDALSGFGGDDRETRRSLGSALMEDANSLGSDTRRAIQRILIDKGFYSGSVDASFGPGTRRGLTDLIEGGAG